MMILCYILVLCCRLPFLYVVCFVTSYITNYCAYLSVHMEHCRLSSARRKERDGQPDATSCQLACQPHAFAKQATYSEGAHGPGGLEDISWAKWPSSRLLKADRMENRPNFHCLGLEMRSGAWQTVTHDGVTGDHYSCDLQRSS